MLGLHIEPHECLGIVSLGIKAHEDKASFKSSLSLLYYTTLNNLLGASSQFISRFHFNIKLGFLKRPQVLIYISDILRDGECSVVQYQQTWSFESLFSLILSHLLAHLLMLEILN